MGWLAGMKATKATDMHLMQSVQLRQVAIMRTMTRAATISQQTSIKAKINASSLLLL